MKVVFCEQFWMELGFLMGDGEWKMEEVILDFVGDWIVVFVLRWKERRGRGGHLGQTSP